MQQTKIKIFNFLFIFFISFNLSANEIKTLASVDNYSITNYDLFFEISVLEKINNNKVPKNYKNLILNQLINEKVKELEVNKNNILISEQIINESLNRIKKKENINNDIKKYLSDKIIVNLKWNKLINLKFGNRLGINMNEINEIMNSNKKSVKKDEIIKLTKNKKINQISLNYFNQIKSNYLIKIY